jgi:hypothetical protein
MTVDISSAELVADRVWYDVTSGKLLIQAGEFVNGIDFAKIPDADFESATPVVSFCIAQGGSIVVCRHKDDAETWLPVDMWLPAGFTPPQKK